MPENRPLTFDHEATLEELAGVGKNRRFDDTLDDEDNEQIQALSENLEAAHKEVMDQGKTLERLLSLARAEQTSMAGTLDRVRKAIEKLGSPARRF